MAGSAIQLSSNLANIVGGPVELSGSQQRMSAPRGGLARIGRGLFGSGEATIDITDPASLDAAAQAAMEEGDRALAIEYMQQARAIRSEQFRDKQAFNAKIEAKRAEGMAGKRRVEDLMKENSEGLREIVDRSNLLREAGARGYNDIIAASRGMSNADISKAMLNRSKEEREADAGKSAATADADAAKQLREHQIAALEELAALSGDPKITRLAAAEANRVRAGGAFDTAYSTVTRAMGADGPVGVIATDDQVTQINDALQSIPLPGGVVLDDLTEGDRFRIANQVVNAQRRKPKASIDELIVEVVGRYNPEDDSDKLGFQDDTLGSANEVINFEDLKS